MASILCSSIPVPSVVTTNACVSPLVNNAEPWVLLKTPVSQTIGLTVLVSRPSILLPVFRSSPLTTSFSTDLIASETITAVRVSLKYFSSISSFISLSFSTRFCFSVTL